MKNENTLMQNVPVVNVQIDAPVAPSQPEVQPRTRPVFTGLENHAEDTATAGNFHTGNSDFGKVVLEDHLRELLDITGRVVQFGTGDHHGVISQKLRMEAGIGHRHAIGGDEQSGTLKYRGCGG